MVFWQMPRLLSVKDHKFTATSAEGDLLLWTPWGFPGTLTMPLLFTASLLLVPWSALISKRLQLRLTGSTVIRMLVVLVLWLGLAWGSQYVDRLGKAAAWIIILAYVVGFVYIIYQVARGAMRSFRDRRELKRLPPVTAISRSEIKMMLGRFATNTYRRKFVRWLADRRIIPTGTWPPGFSLSDRADPAITDLARLEERWLGLDR
jgi:uncharacterized membrane protein YhaH (DUF805 family)